MLKRLFVLMALWATGLACAGDETVLCESVVSQNTCVVGYTEERIYLNPDRIFPTEQGWYLNINDRDYVQLPTLYSDAAGCYIPVPCLDTVYTCPGCGRPYFLVCTYPDCPLIKQKQEKEREKEKEKKRKKEEKKRSKK